MIEVSRAAIIAAYELLRTQKPFLGWRLPNPGDVEFQVIGGRDRFGDCDGDTIRISRAHHGHLPTLLATVAHEMIHLHQMRNKLETANTQHNADWHRRAKRVCRLHGFDPRSF